MGIRTLLCPRVGLTCLAALTLLGALGLGATRAVAETKNQIVWQDRNRACKAHVQGDQPCNQALKRYCPRQCYERYY